MSVAKQAISILQAEHNFKFPWICRRCTYINDNRIDECCLCHYPNPEYDTTIASDALLRARDILRMNHSTYGEKLRNTFKKWPVLLPVIHVKNEEQALRNAQRAFNAGCDGIWLIHHSGSFEQRKPEQNLARCYKEIRNQFPEKWIGVNLLSFTNQPLNIFSWVKENCPNCNGIWTDNAFATSTEVMKRIAMVREEVGWEGLYFGGVAFKYQEKIHPLQDSEEAPQEVLNLLKEVTQNAKPYVDVIVTSGTVTGGTPALAKIATMHSVACPLAITGCGIDIAKFRHYGDVFFAASAISVDCPVHGVPDNCEESFTELDEAKMKNWVNSVSSICSSCHETDE